MPEIIKKHWNIALIFGIGLSLTVWGLLGMMETMVFPMPALAATQTVGVTATVEQWLTFDVTPDNVTLSPNLVDSAGVTKVASSSNITVYLGTNNSTGWSVNVKSNGTSTTGGLVLDTAPDELIETVSGNSLLTDADDDDGYGANATSSLTTVETNYANWSTFTVGQLLTSNSVLITVGTPNASTTAVTMKIYAECDSVQANGSYTDTVTLTTVPNI